MEIKDKKGAKGRGKHNKKGECQEGKELEATCVLMLCSFLK